MPLPRRHWFEMTTAEFSSADTSSHTTSASLKIFFRELPKF